MATNGTKSRNSESNWMLCASWLNDCESLPDNLKTNLSNNDLKFADFAECLKDGLVLCNLLDYLIPGCVDFAKLHVQYAYLPRALCIDNIKIFLDACKNSFEMDESDLFEPEMVYDLDLAPVIRSLSSLSRCKAAQARCNGGFVYDEENDAGPTTGDSIYEEIYKKKVVCGNYIQMAPFILSMNTDEISQYAEILKLSSQTKASGLFEATANLNPPKHVHIIKEIIVTEETFIKMIKCLIDDYLKPLSSVLTENDRKIISLNFETILNVHCKFYDGLYDACLVPENRTLKICEVFMRFKKQFMADYGEYFSKINDTNIKLNQLIKSKRNSAFKRKLEECRAKSSFSCFSITDFVILPFQRISKYHMLLKELYKSKSRSSDTEEAKNLIKSTWEAAEDVCAYLNEMQKDQECINRIESLAQSLHLPFKNFNKHGRFLKDDKFAIKCSNSTQSPRTRTALLFEKSLIFIKNTFNKYEIVDNISIYDIKSLQDRANRSSASLFYEADSINVIMKDESKTYEFHFKNVQQKLIWKEALSSVTPKLRLHNSHAFSLTNFGKSMEDCKICNKPLNGIFYQGYKCDSCDISVHKKCLSSTEPCRNVKSGNNEHVFKKIFKTERPGVLKNNSEDSISLDDISLATSAATTPRTPIESRAESNGETLHCKSYYKYKGVPKPPFKQMLLFEENELIYVVDYDDDEWWKGYKFSFKTKNGEDFYKEEGYFPKTYVKKIELKNELHFNSWYLAGDRDLATLILNRLISFTNSKSIYLVRSRAKVENSFAISFTHSNKVGHLKINQEKFDSSFLKYDEQHANKNVYNCGYFVAEPGAETSKNNLPVGVSDFYSIDKRKFLSISDLIRYYSDNSLQEYFHDYDVKLENSFRDCLPVPLYTVRAKMNFQPQLDIDNSQMELKVNEKYFVLNDEDDNWYYVFDANALLGYVPKTYLEFYNSR